MEARCSRVDEGDHDVAGALGDAQALVVVRKAARVHEQPAAPRVAHRAVVPQEPTTAALVVHVW